MLCSSELLYNSFYSTYPVQSSWLERRDAEGYLFRTVHKMKTSTDRIILDSNLTKLQNLNLSGSAHELKRTLLEPPRSILKRSASADSAKVKDIKIKLLQDLNQLQPEHTKDDISIQHNGDVDNTTDEQITRSYSTPRSPSKNVTFADNLVQVRNFVPSNDNLDLWATFQERCLGSEVIIEQQNRKETEIKLTGVKHKYPSLHLCFTEPSSAPEFAERFKHRCVALEKCATRDRTITGVILVKNIEYHKDVLVRYTLDSWKTSSDTKATYLPNSNDGDTDRFAFSLTLPKSRRELEFAIRFKTPTNEFWDNNYNRNYKVQDVLEK